MPNIMSPLDPDSDDDGIPDYGEVSLTDSDGGGIPDRLEEHWNMNIHDARDEADDYDGDKKMPGIMYASEREGFGESKRLYRDQEKKIYNEDP